MPIRALPQFADWLLADQRDLEIQDPALHTTLLDGNWQPQVRAVRTLLAGYGGRLGIHGPYDGFSLKTRDERLRALLCERLRQALAFGAELGASHMVLHSPFLFLGQPQRVHTSPRARANVISQTHAVLDEVLPLAEQAGCVLVLENILDSDPAPLLALVRSFGSPYVRLSLDTGHAFITQQRGGPTPHGWVQTAGPLLAHVHLHDNDGSADCHRPPGEGCLDWAALFAALAALPQPPRLLLELRQKQDISRALAWLVARRLAR